MAPISAVAALVALVIFSALPADAYYGGWGSGSGYGSSGSWGGSSGGSGWGSGSGYGSSGGWGGSSGGSGYGSSGSWSGSGYGSGGYSGYGSGSGSNGYGGYGSGSNGYGGYGSGSGSGSGYGGYGSGSSSGSGNNNNGGYGSGSTTDAVDGGSSSGNGGSGSGTSSNNSGGGGNTGGGGGNTGGGSAGTGTGTGTGSGSGTGRCGSKYAPSISGAALKSNLVAQISKITTTKSGGKCATAVSRAVEAALGLAQYTIPRPASADAKDYGSFLTKAGFQQVATAPGRTLAGEAQAGDIVIFPGNVGDSAGHITVFTGSKWVSDFSQIDVFGGSARRNVNQSGTLWRPCTA